MRRKMLWSMLAVAGATACFLIPALAQQASSQQPELHVLPVQGNIYMLLGAGGNITLQIGKDGVLLVDTGLAQNSEKVLAEIRKLTPKPIRYIINTHVHADHTGGNAAIAKAGSTIAGGNVSGNLQDAGEGAAVLAYQSVLDRMSAPLTANQPAIPFAALPTDTYITNEKHMFFNGEGIEIVHEPAAHTDGDSFVFFRRSDVVSAGDIFTPANYPVIDIERGGNIQGIIGALNKLIEMTIPAEKQEAGTYVIPGHGRLCDQADVVEYRDMATIIRDRVRDMIKKGMTLEQVKAAKPTRDYDPEYGSTTGFWTTDKFVEAVYRSLAPKT
ncbi:MAG: MBL fold metallo-hydrolase [Acidobacteriia bacterium]|nr:MBL fold metallo-hydrolase [Terriglobia bacterium]MBV8906856.1 MBL fold metallo-hydrolase [Terriglobia bacterium]